MVHVEGVVILMLPWKLKQRGKINYARLGNQRGKINLPIVNVVITINIVSVTFLCTVMDVSRHFSNQWTFNNLISLIT